MKKRLRIGVLAPPWNHVPPKNYGGTEMVVDLLCRGFASYGHEPVLFCSGDSTCPVERHYIIERAVMPPSKYQEHIHIGHFIEQANHLKLDLVHSHLEAVQPYAKYLNCPVVCTLHVELDRERKKFIGYNERVKYIAISHSHASTFPFEVPVIHHGLELYNFPFRNLVGEYLLFIGELSEKKGVDIAMKTAIETGIPLKIAGYLPAHSKDWFNRQVHIIGKNKLIQYMGKVSNEVKLKLMQEALCLLAPIRWEEPFGLVAIEAMACGTPVIAMSRGALPELIEDEVTGFICASDKEFFERAAIADAIDPKACRKRVENRFEHLRMICEYLELFERVIDK
jgi:glycosyltransferase involved in cell wall biosynthesis